MASAGNAPPLAGNDAYSTNEDTPLNIGAPGLLANDSDPENGALTAQPLIEGSLRIPHRGVLTQEGEYILLLRGGEVRGSPVAATGLIRVGDAGNAECGGGHIYGLTPAGVRCSWDGVEVSAPLTGAELATELTAAHGNAELRRPDVAARVDGLSFDGPGVPR